MLGLLAFFCLLLQSAVAEELIEGYTHEEAMKLGETMYRKGVLPSGEPMKALVMGDIPFDGRMFTCDDCHQRSGLGSEEGTVITWPTNGKELFAPRRRTGAYRPPPEDAEKIDGRKELPKYYQMEDVRPAYTEESLARVLRVGVDPAGRKLDPIMPKYRLGQSNMRILIYYLKNLSVEFSPGVDEKFIQFATVITDDVSERDRMAMLSALQAHIDAHNSQSRHENKRSASGPFYKSQRHQAYRELKLHVWTLRGPEESWRDQLETYYKKQPVFALLGGITGGSWQPIHGFSEEHKLPCILPITDLPVISDTDWYTLYFSKGMFQEGESAAKYIRAELKSGQKVKVVQLIQQENRRSEALAQGFQQTWEKMGYDDLSRLVVAGDKPITNEDWEKLVAGPDPVVLMVWLDGSSSLILKDLEKYSKQAKMVFASSTLMGNDFSAVPSQLKEQLLVTYPYSLTGEDDPTRMSVRRWLELRKLPLTDFTIQAKMYFLGWMLPGSIKNIRSEFFREYFLEGYDMMIDQDYSIAVYPRLTFGPAQRYASKGCYIAKLKKGSSSDLVPVSDWVTY